VLHPVPPLAVWQLQQLDASYEELPFAFHKVLLPPDMERAVKELASSQALRSLKWQTSYDPGQMPVVGHTADMLLVWCAAVAAVCCWQCVLSGCCCVLHNVPNAT
jgi:hypothetical protein